MYVIIGQGAAGTNAALRLRQLDPGTPVTMITREHEYFYSRIDLPDIIAGKYEWQRAQLMMADNFAGLGIDCRMGRAVIRLDTKQHTVELDNGDCLPYTKLLIATGSVPILPPFAGKDAQGVHIIWTLKQALALREAACQGRAVVIGAGLIGIKTALALQAKGLKVTLIEALPRIMSRQLDHAAAQIIAAQIEANDIEVLTATRVESFETGEGAISGVSVGGRVIPCHLVVVAVGVAANRDLAIAAGINVGAGIVVDQYLRTSADDVYAAGDAAETVDLLTGQPVVPAIWPVAVEQGRVAAANMTGCLEKFSPTVAMNSVEIAGVPLISVGDIEQHPGDEVWSEQRKNIYRKVIIRDKIVRGVICVGDVRQAGVLGNLVIRQKRVEHPEMLVRRDFSLVQLL